MLNSRSMSSSCFYSSHSKSILKMNFKNVCVSSKGALVVLATSILLSTTIILSGGLSTNFIDYYSYVIYAVVSLHYLSYPLFGLLGEKWMRYKVLLVGIILMFVGFFITVFALVTLYFIHLNSIASLLAFILLITSIITVTVFKNTFYVTFTFIFGFGVVVVMIATLCFCCFKQHLVIEPAQHNNPVKLIWKVMKYAWTHKQPVRRGAFTYGEFPPSRLDLCKERYGGPFTTVQVEDVKSFLYILSIVIGTFGYGFVGSKSKICDQYLIIMGSPSSFIKNLFLICPLGVSYLVIVFAVPFHQFIIVPFFSNYIPSMLKRIWIGLVAALVESIMTTVISYFMTRDIRNALIDNDLCLTITNNITFKNELQSDVLTLPFYIMAVPLFCFGVCIFLVQFTIFEFILAQGPRTMQGLLIGIWYINNGIYCVHLTLASSPLGCSWEYYTVKTGVVLISVIIFTIAAYKYKYRQRNELSDVNERVIITEYTERQLLYTEVEDNDDSDITIDDVISI